MEHALYLIQTSKEFKDIDKPFIFAAAPAWVQQPFYGYKNGCVDPAPNPAPKTTWYDRTLKESCYPTNCAWTGGTCFNATVQQDGAPDVDVHIVVVGNCGLYDDYDQPGNNLNWCTAIQMPKSGPSACGSPRRCPMVPDNTDYPVLNNALWPTKTIRYDERCNSNLYPDHSHRDAAYSLPVIGHVFEKGDGWLGWSGDSSRNPDVDKIVSLCDGSEARAITMPDGNGGEVSVPVGSCNVNVTGDCRNSMGYAYHFDVAVAQDASGESIWKNHPKFPNFKDDLGDTGYGKIKNVVRASQCPSLVAESLLASIENQQKFYCGKTKDGKDATTQTMKPANYGLDSGGNKMPPPTPPQPPPLPPLPPCPPSPPPPPGCPPSPPFPPPPPPPPPFPPNAPPLKGPYCCCTYFDTGSSVIRAELWKNQKCVNTKTNIPLYVGACTGAIPPRQCPLCSYTDGDGVLGVIAEDGTSWLYEGGCP